jgi:hypothetical protein
MSITYNQLLEQIQKMTPEQRDATVTVFVTETVEYYPLVQDFPVVFADGAVNDVLDHGHPYLVI